MRTPTILLTLLLPLLSCTDGSMQKTDQWLEKKAARIHEAVLTVDTHTDTPLNFSREDFDFGVRNDFNETRTRIDLPRMKEGNMDGLWFGVFVGQGPRDAEGNANARRRAESILDDIYQVVERFPDDLERIASSGKHAIYLGMENSYPVGNDLDLVDHYYRMGIRYITLVHTRNNDICDSSNDSAEFHGLSPFGESVVSRMNDLGMLVDISHASDESFYDVLELARAPVIASHSCARAICDNPRNLSDEMLLALKENGGVIQLCILSEYVKEIPPNPERDSARQEVFLKHGNYYELGEAGQEAFLVDWYAVDREFPPQLATVCDAVDHIDHIVDLIGIDHVGIGTDFDGGGGLEDCVDVSQMGNITLELVRRGYNASEIRKIWAGNLTRVFREVEKAAL